MSRSVLVDTHLPTFCPREEDQRIGSAASVESWAGILDRNRRVTKSGPAKVVFFIENAIEKQCVLGPRESLVR
jgi:uncharacterized membrane protein